MTTVDGVGPWRWMRAETFLKAGFEPFAKLCVKRVEEDGRAPAPAPVARASPPPPQAAGAGAGGAGRGATAPVSEVPTCDVHRFGLFVSFVCLLCLPSVRTSFALSQLSGETCQPYCNGRENLW